MGYPLTLDQDVKIMDGMFRIFLPNGLLDAEKFTEKNKAKDRVAQLNKQKRAKGGRPANKNITIEFFEQDKPVED